MTPALSVLMAACAISAAGGVLIAGILLWSLVP